MWLNSWGEGKYWRLVQASFIVTNHFVFFYILQKVNWHVEAGNSLYHTFHAVVLGYAANWILYGLCLVPLKHSWWRAIFSFSLWRYVLSTMLIVESAFLLFNVPTTQVLGFKWTWQAMMIYTALTLLLMWLYNRKQVDPVHGFALSFFSASLMSILYELPWHVPHSHYNFLRNPKFFCSAGVMPLLLVYWKYKPNRWTVLPVLLVAAGWLAWLFPNTFWLKRLLSAPLFVSFPLQLRCMGDE